jgi:hypothetical protein
MFKKNEKIKNKINEVIWDNPYIVYLLDTAYKVLKRYFKPKDMELDYYIDPEIDIYNHFIIKIKDKKYRNLTWEKKEEIEMDLKDKIFEEFFKTEFGKILGDKINLEVEII